MSFSSKDLDRLSYNLYLNFIESPIMKAEIDEMKVITVNHVLEQVNVLKTVSIPLQTIHM